MQSQAKTVDDYLKSLPEDRRAAIEAVRAVFKANLDPDIEEGMTYGMIGYYIPHRIYPNGYHCDPKMPMPYAGLASQKSHMSLYLMTVYGSPQMTEWFTAAWKKTGKKLDMGKACVRFKKIEDVALDVLAEALKKVPAKKYIAEVERIVAERASGKTTTKKPAPKKALPKAAAVKKAVKKAAKRTR